MIQGSDIAAVFFPGQSVRPILFVLLLVTGPTSLGAQWRVTALSGSATSHGDARNDADPARPEFHADRPRTLTAAISRDLGAWRIGLEGRNATAALTEAGRAVAVTTFGVFEAWGTGLELGRRLAGGRAMPGLYAGLGIGVDRWTLSGAPARWRSAARGALEADFPVARGWSAVLRGEVTASPSVFTATDLPEGFAQHAYYRIGLVVGVARGTATRNRNK